MAQRLQLQTLLEAIVPNVYFQPPANVQMAYPCIVYARDFVDTRFAGNSPYNQTKRYQVTVIDRNPDSDIPDKVGQMPLCAYNSGFVADNLHHDVFRLFF